MKYSRILGVVAAAALVTTAVAQQATQAPAPATAEPAAASAAEVMPTAEATPAPVAALADSKPATFGDAKAGQTKAGACAACHGVDGNAADPQYPKIAGQHERYIWRQLKLFKSGERVNPIMAPMASVLTEQDMRDIGAYFATQHALAGVADDSAIASGPSAGKKFYQVGEKIYRAGKPEAGVPACLACHGPSGRGNPGPAYPSVGGQHASYTAAKLMAFRGGEAWGKDGNANVIMNSIARNLSDEEIQSLASYIQGLHDSSATPVAAK
ncbi:c-type cytochrome [Arenimonas sp.]|uniref:c-type cytochrome n=1 Tax=Arenimonas sp. TaxID=1872635 RepID=UPI0039E66242